MYDPIAMERIAEVLPDARLIAILRDPASRAYSHYWLNRSRDREPLSFDDALEAEPERLRRDRGSRFFYSYVDRGRYGEQLRAIATRFPADQIHVVLLEDFRRDPHQGFASVCSFLSIADDVAVPSLVATVNGYQEFRSARVRKLLKDVPRTGPGRVVRSAVGRLNRRPASYPPMSDRSRRRIQDELRSDIEDLERWLGHDLGSWKR
jgi:hypothetical protein